MTKNEITGRLKDGGLDASSTNRSAAVYVADAIAGRAVPGWFAYRIVCDSEDTERRARAILSRWYDIDVGGNGVWRLRAKNRVPLMAIKRGSGPTPPTPSANYLYFEAKQANSTVSMMSTLATAPNLEYSTDGSTFQEWQHTTSEGTHTFDTITLGAVGDKVYFRGTNTALADMQNMKMSIFVLSGSLDSGGSVTSLLDNDGVTLTAIPSAALAVLFASMMITNQADTALCTAPTLGNVTSIGDNALTIIFTGCTALTAAADMGSVTTIGVNGCASMYGNCTALTTAADMGSVTTIGTNGCMNMYTGCSSLTLVSDGALTFGFPTLPFTDGGGNTYSTAQDVAHWMTGN